MLRAGNLVCQDVPIKRSSSVESQRLDERQSPVACFGTREKTMSLFSVVAAKSAAGRSLRSRRQCGSGNWPQPRLIDLLYDQALRDANPDADAEAEEWFENVVAELDDKVVDITIP